MSRLASSRDDAADVDTDAPTNAENVVSPAADGQAEPTPSLCGRLLCEAACIDEQPSQLVFGRGCMQWAESRDADTDAPTDAEYVVSPAADGQAEPTPSLCGRLLCEAARIDEQPSQLVFGRGYTQWAENRARGWFPTKGVGRGRAPGSEKSRQRARTLTVQCKRAGCMSLVNLARARQSARKTGRVTFEPGDGCASSTCSRDFRARRFARVQRSTAVAVAAGERLLVCWPVDTADREVWVLPPPMAHRVAERTLEMCA